MQGETMSEQNQSDQQRLAAMLDQFEKLEAGGAAKAGHPEHDRRNQLLDEMQDAVGMAGKMVMEGDITAAGEEDAR